MPDAAWDSWRRCADSQRKSRSTCSHLHWPGTALLKNQPPDNMTAFFLLFILDLHRSSSYSLSFLSTLFRVTLMNFKSEDRTWGYQSKLFKSHNRGRLFETIVYSRGFYQSVNKQCLQFVAVRSKPTTKLLRSTTLTILNIVSKDWNGFQKGIHNDSYR